MIKIITLAVLLILASCTAEKECASDTDCIPASCCHPNSCTTKEKAPDCGSAFCTMNCEPGTLDCGQAECACIKGECKVRNI